MNIDLTNGQQRTSLLRKSLKPRTIASSQLPTRRSNPSHMSRQIPRRKHSPSRAIRTKGEPTSLTSSSGPSEKLAKVSVDSPVIKRDQKNEKPPRRLGAFETCYYDTSHFWAHFDMQNIQIVRLDLRRSVGYHKAKDLCKKLFLGPGLPIEHPGVTSALEKVVRIYEDMGCTAYPRTSVSQVQRAESHSMKSSIQSTILEIYESQSPQDINAIVTVADRLSKDKVFVPIEGQIRYLTDIFAILLYLHQPDKMVGSVQLKTSSLESDIPTKPVNQSQVPHLPVADEILFHTSGCDALKPAKFKALENNEQANVVDVPAPDIPF
ncbi:hypothetical protein KCU65_g469, partial [Aureobasidium melanogenum]